MAEHLQQDKQHTHIHAEVLANALAQRHERPARQRAQHNANYIERKVDIITKNGNLEK